MENTPNNNSPTWSSTTKMVVGLALVALLLTTIIRFNNILGPLIMSFVLAYLFYPLSNFIRTKLKMSWRLSVSIIYLVVFIIILGLLTLGGFAIFEQIASLVKFIQTEVVNIPKYLGELSSQKYLIGPFELDFSTLDLAQLGNQLLGVIQPLLSSLGTLMASLAGGAATTIGWMLFAFLISYFLLSESRGVRNEFLKIKIPGYIEDINLMGIELGQVWNAFLRGQLLIILMTIGIYTVILGSLQVDFYLGLALIAGIARFVPYIGPVIAWTTYGLVTLFQGSTIFGLESFPYALIVIGVAWITDVILDNLVVPRLMGDALEVHPAGVMVGAIVFGSIFGIIGVILAAPVLATAQLFGQYIFNKMFDQDPWAEINLRKPVEKKPPGWLNTVKYYLTPRRIRVQKLQDDKRLERKTKESTKIKKNRNEKNKEK
jgi:predicted PurR-regulated permease PerM